MSLTWDQREQMKHLEAPGPGFSPLLVLAASEASK